MRLSRLSYFGDFVLSPAIAAGLSAVALRSVTPATFGYWILAVIGGALAWTLAEYIIHRSIYHRVEPFQGYHEAHHHDPKALIGAPSVVGIVIIFAVAFAPITPFSIPIACGFTSGFLIGYFAYMMVHHASHHWNLKPGTYLYALRMHHARHHYAHEAGNFGVSTSIWDHVFRTAISAPRRAAGR